MKDCSKQLDTLWLPLWTSIFMLFSAGSALGAPPVKEGDWSINGTKLHYRMVGSGEPILLLHGGPGGNYLAFKPLEELADGYQLIMYDQRGSGQSERFSTQQLHDDPSLISVDKHIEDLEAIRKQLALPKVVLLGHSWGATLAAFYANKYPDQVQKIILYDGGPMWPELKQQASELIKKKLPKATATEIEKRVKLLSENITKWDQDKLDIWFIELAKLNFPALYCNPKQATRADFGKGGFWANYLTNQYEQDFDIEEFSKTFSKVQASALIIAGKCEPNPLKRQTVLRDALPQATMVLFEKSGHNALEEEHELFMKTLRAFLKDQPLPVKAYKEKQ